MKDFDIAKYLREHQLGSYGILNHYVDLKPLKEEESEKDLDKAASAAGKSTQDVVDRLKKLGYSDAEIAKTLNKLKEVEVPYEGPEDKLTGFGDEDSFEQAETVSEVEEEEFAGVDRMEGLINRRDLVYVQQSAQNILDDLTAEGFDAEEVAEFLIDQIKRAAIPYLQNSPQSFNEEEMEEEWYPHDEASLEKGRAKIIKKK